MGFSDAVRTVLTKYAVFSGRARRSEFWWFGLFSVLVSIVMSVIDRVIGNQLLGTLVSLALLLPSLGVTIRRLHDTGRSGWWWLIGVIPLVGWIVLLVFECQDSELGTNRFGPSPKQTMTEPAWPSNPGATGTY